MKFVTHTQKGKLIQDDLIDSQLSMMAVVTTGTGGYEKLEYKRVPTLVAGPGEDLLKVLAAGVNNTEIITRLGWYSKSANHATEETSDTEDRKDGGWNVATPFPFIQGTDCCGKVVIVGEGSDSSRTDRQLRPSRHVS